MKKLVIALIALLLIGAAVYWYFHRDSDKARDVLPADATAVAVFEPAELLDGLGLKKEKASKLVMNLEDLVEGVNLAKPVYAFATQDEFSGIALNVKDVKRLLKAAALFNYASEEQNGYQWIANSNSIGCIDDDKMLIVGPVAEEQQDALRDEMMSLMKQARKDVPVLEKLDRKGTALSLSAPLNSLPKEYVQKYLPAKTDLSDAFLNAALRFGGKDVTLSMGSTIDLSNMPLSPIKGDVGLGGIMPANPFAYICFNMNGEKLLPELRKVPNLRTALLALNLCVDVDMMIKAIDGDVVISVPKPDLQHPAILLTATLSNTDFLKNADDWSRVKRLGVADFVADYEGTQVFFGVRDKYLYITNGSKVASSIGENKDSGMLRLPVKGKYLSASLDIAQLVGAYPGINMMLRVVPQVREVIDALDQVILTADSQQSMQLSLQTKKPVKEVIGNFITLLMGD